MRKTALIFLLLGWLLPSGEVYAQARRDSLLTDSVVNPRDTTPVRLRLFSAGVDYYGGTAQFYDSYSQEVMYLNARSGLTLYNDWDVYSPLTLSPVYYGAGVRISFADSLRKFRLRLGATYSYRKDTMAYRSGFAVNDTIYARDGNEFTRYAGVNATFLVTTKKWLKVLRLYCGGEAEVDIATGSDIYLLEFSYDFGDERIVEFNEFYTRGKTRFNFFVGAVVGLETIFAKRVGFYAEVRSSIGRHWVPGNRTVGMSRNNYVLGLNWYFKTW